MRSRIMRKVYDIDFIFLAVIATAVLVHSQPSNSVSSIENDLKANLTRMVKFVVHPSAKPSKELFNFALASGGRPKTDEERLQYLGLMKKIALKTPELVKRFTVITTKTDGKQSKSLDESGIDVYIASRALQFVQREHSSRAFYGVPLVNIVNSISSKSSSTTPTV